MKQILDIDFISDIACPWCAVGLYSLEKALEAFPGIKVAFHIHPYELAPSVGPKGDNIFEHIEKKYDMPAVEVRQGLDEITKRGAEVGFCFNFNDDSRTWNTFDAHRIIHWAQGLGKAVEMKKSLFTAYFTHNLNPGDHLLLAELAEQNGLDRNTAAEVLASGSYAEEVKKAIDLWKDRGVSAVPTVRLGKKRSFTGAQTVPALERAIRASLEGTYTPGTPLM